MAKTTIRVLLLMLAFAGILRPAQVKGQSGDIVIQAGKFNANPVAISPDGTLIAAATCDKTTDIGNCPQEQIKFWNMKGQPVGNPISAARDFIDALQFSPDGKLLLAGSSDFFVRFWDVK